MSDSVRPFYFPGMCPALATSARWLNIPLLSEAGCPDRALPIVVCTPAGYPAFWQNPKRERVEASLLSGPQVLRCYQPGMDGY